MRELWLIGIGTGHPGHVTLEGQQAMRDAAVVLIPRKGQGKEDLAHLRLDMLKAARSQAQVIPFDMPVRDENLPYEDRVSLWHDQIAERWTAALSDALDGPVALLIWGDPGLYDSTLRIASRLDPAPQLRVVPGITALQALTSAHAIPFNTINGAVTVTTGRRLRDHGWPEGAESVCVMLDGVCSFQTVSMPNLHIWWGAYLGMPEQVLASGPVESVGETIIAKRAAARQRHGWIMDTYLLRRL